MLNLGGAKFKSLLSSTSRYHAPWQVGVAVATGVLCGLLPKTSLLFILVVIFSCCLPMHLLVATLVSLSVSCIQPSILGMLGEIGEWSLSQPQFSNLWRRLESTPYVPWLQLHNTVVHGAFFVGGLLFVPLFLVTEFITAYLLYTIPNAEDQLADFEIIVDEESNLEGPTDLQIEEGIPLWSPTDGAIIAINSPKTSPLLEVPLIAAEECSEAVLNSTVESDVVLPVGAVDLLHTDESHLSALLESCQVPNEQDQIGMSADVILERAERMTSLIDELLESLNESDGKQEVSSLGSSESLFFTDSSHNPISKPILSNNMSQTFLGDDQVQSANQFVLNPLDSSVRDYKVTAMSDQTILNGVRIDNAENLESGLQKHEEALRFLLAHLKELRVRAQ
ncbi:MAG: hypothetical protein KDB03_25665 [Planctomycetales bacterium]|nr:hypothetical protein [Planctomycetales bacterium]